MNLRILTQLLVKRQMKQATINLFKKIFATLKPPPNISLSEWADKYRYLSAKSSAEPGKWSTDRTPYLREVMNAITDLQTEKVVFMSCAQVGKTDGLILNTIGYFIHYDPAAIIAMQPTVKLAESFSKDRLSMMLEDTPVLRGKVNDKGRNSGNTILQKNYPGGHVTMIGANSANDLRSRPIRVLLADEIDGYPATAGKDGDPLALAEKRLTTYWNRKEVYVSTPTVKGLSRIEVEFEHSTQEEWNVPCPACGELQPLEWGNIIFDKEKPEEVSCVCRKCGVVSGEVEWKEHFTEGKFIAKFPNRKVRGFHLNTLSSLLCGWNEIAEKFLKANEEKKKGNLELMKSWTNTEMGQVWEEEGEQLDEMALMKRCEKYNCEVPEDVIVLTAGVDTQDNRFEVEVVGWGEGKESWGIKYVVIYGDLKQAEVWNELDAFLGQTFTRADGAKLKILAACMDSGGHFPNEVYKFCKPRWGRHIYAIKGKGGGEVPYYNRPTKNNPVKCPLFTLGVDTGKSILLARLRVELIGENGEHLESAPGYCHFPREKDRGYNLDYFVGLTSERQIMTYKKGKAVFEWKIKDYQHRRNEALDCRNYATAALEIANPTLKKTDKLATPGASVKKPAGRHRRSKGVI